MAGFRGFAPAAAEPQTVRFINLFLCFVAKIYPKHKVFKFQVFVVDILNSEKLGM